MGKTALRYIMKSSLTEPVFPKTGKDGVKQPPYTRGRIANHTYKPLIAYNSCIGLEMHKYKDQLSGREEAKKKFKEAVETCKALLHK